MEFVEIQGWPPEDQFWFWCEMCMQWVKKGSHVCRRKSIGADNRFCKVESFEAPITR